MECNKCGAEVDTHAEACSKCGAPVFVRPDRLKLIVLAVLLGLGVVLLFTPEPNQDADLTSLDTTAGPDTLATARDACRAAIKKSFTEAPDTQLEPDANWLALVGDDSAIEVLPRGPVKDSGGAYTDREWLCTFAMEGGNPQLVSLTQVPR